jgi:hypothetical protein
MSIMQTYTKQYEMQLFLFGQQILAQVAQDHNLDHTAMVKKYLSTPQDSPAATINNGQNIPAPLLVMASQEKKAKKPRKTNPDKVMCKGVTAKGQPCKFAACAGSEFCKKHNGEAPVRQKKQPVIQHNHPVGEVPQELCQVCDTHGDVARPGLTEEEFTLEEGSIQEKLKAILKESESETEEEPAPVEPAPVPAPLVAPIEELLDADTDGEDTDDEEVIKNKLAQILAMEDEDEDDADDED